MKNKEWMKNRIISAVLAALFMALLVSVHVLALDLAAPVSMEIVPAGADLMQDLHEEDILYDLYQIADAVAVPGSDTYDFSVTDFFRDGTDAVTISQEMDAAAWRIQAGNAFRKVLNENAEPLVRGRRLKKGERLTAADDGALLLPGLYLLVARGADPVLQEASAYADLSDPEGPKSIVYSGDSVYTYSPALIALPYPSQDIDGHTVSTADGEWNYDVTVHLKPERTDRYGRIRIVKKLLNYKEGTKASFVFHIHAVFHGTVVLDEDVTISFNEAGERIREVLIEDLPSGAEVTVEELAPEEGYFLVQAENETQIVSAEQTAEFLFANDYQEEGPPPPETGDRSQLGLYLALAAASGLGLLIVVILRIIKKKKRK